MHEECYTRQHSDTMSKHELDRSNAAIDKIIKSMEEHRAAEKYCSISISVTGDEVLFTAELIGEEHMSPSELAAHLTTIGKMATALVMGR